MQGLIGWVIQRVTHEVIELFRYLLSYMGYLATQVLSELLMAWLGTQLLSELDMALLEY